MSFSNSSILDKLFKLSNSLDDNNLHKEAKIVDYLISKIAQLEDVSQEEVSDNEASCKEIMNKTDIDEKSGEFTVWDLNDDQIKLLYCVFKKSYEAATGSAWTEELFMNRARGWTFFGKVGSKGTGVVAIRFQRGMAKLVAMAGNPFLIKKGFKNLSDKKIPLWGMVSENLTDLVKNYGFIAPSSEKISSIISNLPPGVRSRLGPLSDSGTFSVNVAEIGQVEKRFICNQEYKDLMKQLYGLDLSS